MNKRLKFTPTGSMRELILSFGLIVCISVFADVRASFMASPDTIKIPIDTTAVDSTHMRDSEQTNAFLSVSIPSSPQAQAFQRVGDFTVNNASGMPDISIPLFEIDHHGYKIPIALRYIATPLKPGYNYDVTGHGWSLTLGSCISRTIASLPDEKPDVKFKVSEERLYNEYYYRPDGIYTELAQNNWQLDKFSAVLPDGRSFHFYIRNNNNNTYLFSVSDYRFKNINFVTNGSLDDGFILYDENGVKYTFNAADYSIDPSNMFRKVAWYLSRIDIPNVATPILLYYDAEISQPLLNGLEEPIATLTHYFQAIPQNGYSNAPWIHYSESNPYNYYRTKLLTKVQYNTTTILFNYEDDDPEPEVNYMTSMVIKDYQDVKRTIQMQYDMHEVRGTPLAHLSSLTITGSDSTTDPLIYEFDYRDITGYPGTDLWGNCSDNYYKQNIGNFNLYVEFDTLHNSLLENSYLIRFIQKDPSDPCPYQKANLVGRPTYNPARRALPPYLHGVLKTIYYPTGGKTLFEFENHRFVSATAANGDYIETKKNRDIMEGGGFRIRTITNYTADGNVADIRNFRYGPTFREINQQNLNLPADPNNYTDQNVGYGEPVVDPNILTFTRFSTSEFDSSMRNTILYMLTGMDPYGHRVSFVNPFIHMPYTNYDWRWDCHFSPIYFQRLLQGRNPVVYSEITEYHGDIGDYDDYLENATGKTVYKYDIYNLQDSSYYMKPYYCGNVLMPDESYAPKDYLTEKCNYKYENGTFTLVDRETYTYNSETHWGATGYIFRERYSPGFTPNLYQVLDLVQGHFSFLGRSILTGKSHYQYSNTGTVVTTETYNFNTDGLMTQKSFTGNKPMVTTYTYPSTSDTGIPGMLAARNMLSTVLQSKTKAGENNQQVDVSGYKIDYGQFNSKLLPSNLYRLNTSFTGSSFEEDQQVLSYTANGNPVEVVDKGGVHTFYLWSYADRYLVAEIKNATESQVSSALNSAFGKTISGLASLASVSITNLNNLRINSALSGALVTTWTHRPLVGITSQTDPAGVTTHYDYDGLGRLKEVYRYDGNNPSSTKRILNQYTYHVSNSINP